MDIISVKPLEWLGDSRKALRSFPLSAQRVAGFELRNIQKGNQPADFKPMPSIGTGVEELRVWVEEGTYRVIYIARLPEAVYVLHAFQKKTQRTNQRDLALARARLDQLLRHRKTNLS
ncbi:MAG TPA: type II toxin-antitoxin system RelE/ParE family toxin [Acidobacteriaceae bacterium]